MTEDECLDRFGFPPAEQHLPAIREVLASQADRERVSQGDGDTEVMRLCCAMLFSAGEVADAELIWRAKTSSMDTDASIDIQLLCGAGVAATQAFFGATQTPEAEAALKRIGECIAAGDFEDFSVDGYQSSLEAYYEE